MFDYLLQALLTLTLVTAAMASLAQVTYRCGSSYSQSPCPGGVMVDTRDARTNAQKVQTDLATQRDMRAANAMEKSRLLQESKDRVALTAGKPASRTSASTIKGDLVKTKKAEGSADLVVKSPARAKKPASAASASAK